MSPRPLGIGTLLALVGLLAAAAPAAADFGPIQMISSGAAQPADKAEAPAVSVDGRFVAFQASIGGREGVFERNLETGSLVPVAVVNAYEGAAAVRSTRPSLSADGRFVAFTSRAPLDPLNDSSSSPDVYVADLSYSPPRYELASARDGCDPELATGCGLAYSGAGGAEASGRVALSADGSRVAFYTTAPADAGGGVGAMPAGQVLVRDLAADTTTLVSAERDPLDGTMTSDPVQGGTLVSTEAVAPLRGAAISGDGSTVAWVSTNLARQVALTPAEAAAVANAEASAFGYDEPLWRRIAAGPEAPTRRIVGGADGSFPATGLVDKNTTVNAIQGWLGAGGVTGVPALSADGLTAALIGNPREATDLFLVDMRPGLTRAQAVRQLTAATVIDPTDPSGTINVERYVPLTGHVFDLALAPEGQRLVFATARQRFPLAPPNLISAPPSSPGLVELYMIDLASGAMQRATHGVGGATEASAGAFAERLNGQVAASVGGEGARSPSISATGLIAFASTASNLVGEDSNEASDAFVVQAKEAARLPNAAQPEPVSPRARRRLPWKLRVSAFSLPGGGVKLVVLVPAAGRVRASVAPEPGGAVSARRLASSKTRARGAGRVVVALKLPARLRRFTRTREGVYALARVSFRHKGRARLEGRVQVRFRAHAKGGRR